MKIPNNKIDFTRRFIAQLASQGLAAVGALVLTMIVGSSVGPEGLGQFGILMTLLGLLQIVAGRGQNSLITRTTAWTEIEYGRWASSALTLRSIRIVILPSLIFGVLGAVLLMSGQFGTPLRNTLLFFPILLLIVCVLSVLSGYMRGTNRAWAGPMLENGGVSLVASLILLIFWAFTHNISVYAALAAFALSAFLLCSFTLFTLRRVAPSSRSRLVILEGIKIELVNGQLAFVGIGLGTYLVQAGALVLAAPFLTDIDLGLLRASERFAILVNFPVLCMSPLLIPKLMPAIRNEDQVHLRRLIFLAVVAAGLLAAPPLAVIILFSTEILGLIGTEFERGKDFLPSMAVIQFASALVTPLGLLLTLSGKEKVSMYIHWAVLAVAAVLIPTLTEYLGISGFIAALVIVTLLRVSLIGSYSMRALLSAKGGILGH